MNRDPTKIGRSRAAVSAEMLAEVVEGFLEGISWRSLVIHFLLSAISDPSDCPYYRYSLYLLWRSSPYSSMRPSPYIGQN
jgi:hypothetical protein